MEGFNRQQLYLLFYFKKNLFLALIFRPCFLCPVMDADVEYAANEEFMILITLFSLNFASTKFNTREI